MKSDEWHCNTDIFCLMVLGVSLDIENYCTLRLFFDLVDLNWSQTTKLT